MPRRPTVAKDRKFKITDGLGKVLDATLQMSLESEIARIKKEVADRVLSESTFQTFVAWGYLLPGVSSDPRIEEVDLHSPEAGLRQMQPITAAVHRDEKILPQPGRPDPGKSTT